MDFGSAVPYLHQQLLEWLSLDEASKETSKALENHIRVSTKEASLVQCVGMFEPIRIQDIYQPTRLRIGNAGQKTVDDLMALKKDAVVFARAGEGKSTLLHWIYVQSVLRAQQIPLLFSLRRSSVREYLTGFVNRAISGEYKKSVRKLPILLLVDGYDEISSDEQRRVSDVLLQFSSAGIGSYLLTCRNYYEVYELRATECQITEFERGDALRFVEKFSGVYGTPLDPVELLRELDKRSLSKFWSHPLFLSLVCILRTGANPALPTNSINLMRRVLDTLAYRWDDKKGVHRESTTGIDGDQRVRCLMYIAHQMPLPGVSENDAFALAEKFLRLHQRQDISPRSLLVEIAKFYGLFVPAGDTWQFVHRTIHDFLAARYWVESGKFARERRSIIEWNARASYAACLEPDATESIESALAHSDNLYAFSECLYNSAAMDTQRVATAVIAFYTTHPSMFSCQVTEKGVDVEMREGDWLRLASDELLSSLLLTGLSGRSNAHDLVVVGSTSEMKRRRLDLPTSVINQLRQRYPGMTFNVRKVSLTTRMER